MKILINKNVLYSALSRIQGVVEKSSIMPITANALITADKSGLSISATNLEIGMISNYSDVNMVKGGTISVNAKRFFDIIRELPDDVVSIEEKDNYLIEIICNNIRFNILGLPPEDFPIFFQDGETQWVEWNLEKIKKLIDYTSFSISNDISRLNICGAFLEKLEDHKIRMVTTDGYRVSIVDDILGEDVLLEKGIIIPKKGIIELRKLIGEKKDKKLFIKIIQNSIAIKIDEVQILIRLIEKKFPDYRYIIPATDDNCVQIEIEKVKIKQALKRMSTIADENKRPVDFTFSENEIDISTNDVDFGSVKEIITMEKKAGRKFSFSINGSYLLDILNAVDDNITVKVNVNEDKPIIISPISQKNIMYIIMPMVSD